MVCATLSVHIEGVIDAIEVAVLTACATLQAVADTVVVTVGVAKVRNTVLIVVGQGVVVINAVIVGIAAPGGIDIIGIIEAIVVAVLSGQSGFQGIWQAVIVTVGVLVVR